jgi:glycosyltransferase involved in cell wall biosynthesis
MRVGVNAAISQLGISGTARVVEHIERALRDSGIDVTELRPPARPGGHRVKRAASDAYWDLWRAARVEAVDVFISPCNVGRAPRGVPHLLWIQDTMVLDHPEWYHRRYAAYARLVFGFSARSCTRVVTASRHTAARIEARWPSAAPVEVIPWPTTLQTSTPRRYDGRGHDVLMVARTQLHKNHLAAIDAVRLARLETGEDIRLRLVGPSGPAEDHVWQMARVADPDGAWVSRFKDVPGQELEEMYRGSWVLIQPSLDEGFGLPLLEAAAHALPAVHSGRGAMPEVVSSGNAGSIASAALAAELIELLDGSAYERASAAALESARRHSRDAFRSDLLGVLGEVSKCS